MGGAMDLVARGQKVVRVDLDFKTASVALILLIKVGFYQYLHLQKLAQQPQN